MLQDATSYIAAGECVCLQGRSLQGEFLHTCVKNLHLGCEHTTRSHLFWVWHGGTLNVMRPRAVWACTCKMAYDGFCVGYPTALRMSTPNTAS
jgi:alpha-D-ribose 1-methylphosphonate 5-triphosphate synthase subunit PhnL